MRYAFVLLCVASVVSAGDPAADDAKKLQGAWQVVKGAVNGMEVGPEVFKGVQFVFKDDVVTFQSSMETNSAKFKLDVTRNPRHINTVILDGKAKDQSRLGIYEVEDDTLKLCWGDALSRPAGFVTKDGDKFINIELKRVTK